MGCLMCSGQCLLAKSPHGWEKIWGNDQLLQSITVSGVLICIFLHEIKFRIWFGYCVCYRLPLESSCADS